MGCGMLFGLCVAVGYWKALSAGGLWKAIGAPAGHGLGHAILALAGGGLWQCFFGFGVGMLFWLCLLVSLECYFGFGLWDCYFGFSWQ